VRSGSIPGGPLGPGGTASAVHASFSAACAVVATACGLFVSACGAGSGDVSTHVVESSRVVEADPSHFHGATTGERFGLHPSRATDRIASTAPEGPGSNLQWITPQGWEELAPTSMRAANFRPVGEPHVECYLTLLAGDGGGLAANVNRWRAQLALAPLGANEIAALPTSEMLGGKAVLLEASGTWKGMSGTEARSDFGVTGLLLVAPEGSAFLKMVGPAAALTAQRTAFLELAASFRPRAAAETTPILRGDEIHDGRETHDAHGDEVQGANGDEARRASGSGGGFAFDLPAGWRRAPDEQGRAASFYVGAGEELECTLTTFPGEAGGVLANVNRWRGQLGEPPIAASDLASLTKVSMLGREAVLVECSNPTTQLLGAICIGPERSVFAKLSGPKERVGPEREAFLAFCASLRPVRSGE